MKTFIAHVLATIIISAFVYPPLFLALLIATEMQLNIPQSAVLAGMGIILGSIYLSVVTRAKARMA